MVFTEVNRLPVGSLAVRYGISRPTLYGRIGALSIVTEKIGKIAYVGTEQIALLDGLDRFLAQGGSTADYQERHGLLPQQLGIHSKKPPEGGSMSLREASYLFHELAQQLPQQHGMHWSERLRILQEAADRGWLLSTQQLAELLGVSGQTLLRVNGSKRFGFEFKRAGRNGAEIAWQVRPPSCRLSPF
ncbi:MAG: hypothetical protein ACRC62_35005 [Microcoleus sp.]